VSQLELTHYVRNQLLRESDALSMASGIELRTPFLDWQLFDALAAIPASVRLRPGKHLLRAAVPDLPAWAGGGKLVFQFPFTDWLQGEWRDVFAAADAASPVVTGTWYRKWSIFMLERWIERLKRHE
jgi:asparagine synthase (glutamine-hydrolysing)